MAWTATTIGILGLWLAVAPFLGLGHMGNFWSDFIVGFLVAVPTLAVVGRKPTLGWIGGLLGTWMVIAAFIPGLHVGAALYWNNILVGLIVACVGFGELSTEDPRTA